MENKEFGFSFLEDLTRDDQCISKRESSFNREGKNYDWIHLLQNEKRVITELYGPGAIKHMYFTILSFDPFYYRNIILRIYWDFEPEPSVEVPIGDFFGIGHCHPSDFRSLLITVNLGDPNIGTHGLNCYFPMPFHEHARIEVENISDIPLESLWYHIDYQIYKRMPDEILKFHSQWRRESPTYTHDDAEINKNEMFWEGINTSGIDNYIIMEAEGRGKLAGIILEVDNYAGGWWGEGDDMVFIDGEAWPPSINGTGTEEIFGGGACPNNKYDGPYAGFSLINNQNWFRKNTMYRFFILDPIYFQKSIRYTIEHGHANNFENDYASVGYWYQSEPHRLYVKDIKSQNRIPYLNQEAKMVSDLQIETVKKLYQKVEYLQGKPQGSFKPLLDLLIRKNKAEKEFLEGHYEYAFKEWELIGKFVKEL